jgi:hypothetical protein
LPGGCTPSIPGQGGLAGLLESLGLGGFDGLLTELGIDPKGPLGQVLGAIGEILPKIPGIDPNIGSLLNTLLNNGVPSMEEIFGAVRNRLPEDAQKALDAIIAAIRRGTDPPPLPGRPTNPALPGTQGVGGSESVPGEGENAGSGPASDIGSGGEQPCVYHSGRKSVSSAYGKPYCEKCTSGIATAMAEVDSHISPRECFVEYKGNDQWGPIYGTGCAHWVAHEKGITSGGQKCQAGFTLRVSDLVSGRPKVNRGDVQPGDIWAEFEGSAHCGIVRSVESLPNGSYRYTIENCADGKGVDSFVSVNAGSGGSKGYFYR